jgi:alpha-L-fucosidase
MKQTVFALSLLTILQRAASHDQQDEQEIDFLPSPYDPNFAHATQNQIDPAFETLKERFTGSKIFEPTWPSLESRPIPSWYDQAKFGVLLHTGISSVPAFISEDFWHLWEHDKDRRVMSYMKESYPERFTYQGFAREFTAEFFNSTSLSALIKASGARYVVLNAKHHDGFTLWKSQRSFSWNSVEVGPKLDFVADLSQAVRKNSLRFGIQNYWSEHSNPLYVQDKKNGYRTSTYVDFKAWPEWKELVETYKPDLVLSDGDWEARPNYWKSRELLAWLFNESPVKDSVVVNDRWGKGKKQVYRAKFYKSCRFRCFIIQLPFANTEGISHVVTGITREN